jgi:DNA (cytosine-5)-methyltransferase 1
MIAALYLRCPLSNALSCAGNDIVVFFKILIRMPIKIVDLFAGPGGLGEGFSALNEGRAFQIVISAEMDRYAHATLRLRSYFRHVRSDSNAVDDYYAFCNGIAEMPFGANTLDVWEDASKEARQLTLGDPSDNAELDSILDRDLLQTENWVLIGGPPCQAYSLVGRSRNIGTPTYKAEDDHRHYLYKEYLRIIRDRRPPVFVMENVKGILSATVSGNRIFDDILRDLSDPDSVFDETRNRPGYKIHSLVSDTYFERGMDPSEIDPRDFIVRSEEFGIPQARHRVILLGVRSDIDADFDRLELKQMVNVESVIQDLPALRSKLSITGDDPGEWASTVKGHMNDLAVDAKKKGMHDLANNLIRNAKKVRVRLASGDVRFPKDESTRLPPNDADWYLDTNLDFWLNHEARSHMTSDLRRYAYASTYAETFGISPKGHKEFSLKGLAPKHENWETGKFADRFRVQRYDAPASTVTSHIAKDGHYFIHPDPAQCRSLTVREAARLQTFPDNYFFMGNRTQQYHQVGNAVPPKLAYMIAEIVNQILLPLP